MTTLLIDAEMKMFAGVKTPVIFLQNLIVDLLLGLGFKDAFTVFADHVRERYDAEPGFITMNLPMLLDVLDEVGIENPIVCSNINKIGFRMCGGIEAYETGPARARVPGDRDVGLRLRGDPAGGGDRVGLRAAEPATRSSSAPPARATSAPRASSSTATGGLDTLLVASTGGHLKQLHQLVPPPHHHLGPLRWATFDTPQSRSLLEGEEVDYVPFVGGRDLANVARNLPHARRILSEHQVDTMVSTGSAVALPFYRAGTGAAVALPLHRERRPQRGAVD